jgi:hypothetical protein
MNKLEVSVGIKNAAFKAGLDEMKRGAAEFKGELSSMFVGAVGPAALAAGAILTVKKAFEKAGEMERFEVQFRTLLGTMGAATQRMKELSTFAASTPFELPEIAQASKTLQTLTDGALATGDGLRIVGDAAAASGADFGELAVTIGRVYAATQAGSATIGAEINRLVELGIVSVETKNKLQGLLEAGKKGSEVWAVAEQDLNRFSGSMENLSETLEGKVSTMSDAWAELLRTFAQPLLPSAKEQTDNITGLFDTLKGAANILGQSFKGLFAYIAGGVDMVIGGWFAVGAAISGVSKSIMSVGKGNFTEAKQALQDAMDQAKGYMSQASSDFTKRFGSEEEEGGANSAAATAQRAQEEEMEKSAKKREERLQKIADAEADAAREALEGQQKINALIEERNRLLEVFKANSDSDEGIDALEKAQQLQRKIESEEERQAEERKRREDEIAQKKADEAEADVEREQRIAEARKSEAQAREDDIISTLKGDDKIKALQTKAQRMQAEADLLEESDPEAAARKRTEIIGVNAEIRSEREALKDDGSDKVKDQEGKVKDAQGKVEDARRAAASVPVDSLGAVGGGRGNFGGGDAALRVAERHLSIAEKQLAALQQLTGGTEKKEANPWR